MKPYEEFYLKMERHVTDQFLWCEYTDEKRSDLLLLYEEALNRDKGALLELMNNAYHCECRESALDASKR